MQISFEQAFLLCQEGKYAEAIDVFDIYISTNDKHFEAYYNRGLAHFYLANYEKALFDFDSAININPYIPDVISQRGVTFFHLKKLVEALADMDKAANLEPKNPYRYSSRAYIKASMGDTEGAIADYEKAIEIDPEDAVAYNNLGLLQEQLGYKKKAKDNFEKADDLAKEIFGDGGTDKEQITKEEFDRLMKENLKSEQEADKSGAEGVKKMSVFETAKLVFASKESRKDFLRFVKNKFGLK